MGWVKLDDGFYQHPKVVGLSLRARWAYIESLCYAAKYETDGDVPESVAAKGSVRAELMASGLWENSENGVSIHDYLVYNPSRSEREQNRNRTRSFRASREGDGLGTGSGSGSEGGVQGGGFEVFWQVYPRKVGKPKARSAFAAALRRASFVEIMAGAERLRDDPNRTDEFTPHPTTWLNRDGWEDAPLPPRNGKVIHDRAAEIAARAMGGGGDDPSRGADGRGLAPGRLPS